MKAIAVLLFLALLPGCTLYQGPQGFGGSWKLVQIQEVGGSSTRPDVKAKYTLDFDALGRVDARVDCNYGKGRWETPSEGQLRISQLALTRAACPGGSLHDRIVKQLPTVQAYSVKQNRLLLTMASGEVYEYEPSAAMGTITVP